MSKINTKKTYIRDKRSPIAVSEQVSYTMSRIRAKNTKPEVSLRKAMWADGMRGYRLHWKQVPGKPDICFPGQKKAIFVNGCYWHRCPHCDLSLPKSNTDFWKEKFKKNILRDKRKLEELERLNWGTLVLWECEIKRDIDHCLEKTRVFLSLGS